MEERRKWEEETRVAEKTMPHSAYATWALIAASMRTIITMLCVDVIVDRRGSQAREKKGRGTRAHGTPLRRDVSSLGVRRYDQRTKYNIERI